MAVGDDGWMANPVVKDTKANPWVKQLRADDDICCGTKLLSFNASTVVNGGVLKRQQLSTMVVDILADSGMMAKKERF